MSEPRRLEPDADDSEDIQARTSPRLRLSLVIPAYNETARIDAGMARLAQAFADGSIDPKTTEVIAVDDGSVDGTGDRLASILARFPHTVSLRLPVNRGKGAAVRAGVAVASATFTAFADADMSVEPRQLATLMARLDRAGVAIGSRVHPDSEADHDSQWRKFVGRTFSVLANTVTRVSLRDTQCGFKAFRTPVARLLFHCNGIDRFAFDVALVAQAQRWGVGIAEIPVRFTFIPGSRIRPLRDPLRMITDVVSNQFGLTPYPPIHGVLLRAPADEVSRALGNSTPAGSPVLIHHAEGTLVLFPLVPEHQALEGVEAVCDALPNVSQRRQRITGADLASFAPLHIVGTPDLD